MFYSVRVACLMVVKSTAFSVLPKCQSYNILYRINILNGLTLINMYIKTKQSFDSSLVSITSSPRKPLSHQIRSSNLSPKTSSTRWSRTKASGGKDAKEGNNSMLKKVIFLIDQLSTQSNST